MAIIINIPKCYISVDFLHKGINIFLIFLCYLPNIPSQVILTSLALLYGHSKIVSLILRSPCILVSIWLIYFYKQVISHFINSQALSLDERERKYHYQNVKKKFKNWVMTLQSLVKSTQLKICFPSFPKICICSFFWLCLLHTSIFDNCKTAWILCLIYSISTFVTDNFGNGNNFSSRSFNGDVILKYDSWFTMKTLWWIFVPKMQIVAIGISWHKYYAKKYFNQLLRIVFICWMRSDIYNY